MNAALSIFLTLLIFLAGGNFTACGSSTQDVLTSYSGPSGSIGYGYDLAGNLAGAKSGTVGGYDVSYDYDALNRLSDVYRGQEGTDPCERQSRHSSDEAGLFPWSEGRQESGTLPEITPHPNSANDCPTG